MREFWINMFKAPSRDGVAFHDRAEAISRATLGVVEETIHVVEAPPSDGAEGPFCKDCKHMMNSHGGNPPLCAKSRRVELVYGTGEYFSCGVMRKPDEGRCGPGGGWFDPKVSVWDGREVK